MAKIRNTGPVPTTAADPRHPGVERTPNSTSTSDDKHPAPSAGGGSTP